MPPKLRGRAAALEQMAERQGGAGGAGLLSPVGIASTPPPAPSGSSQRPLSTPVPMDRSTFAERVGDVKDSVEKARAEYRTRAKGALGGLPSGGPSAVTSGMHRKFMDLEAKWGEVMDMSNIDPFSALTPQVNAASAALARNRRGLDDQVNAVIEDLWDGVSSGQARTMTDSRKDDMMQQILSTPGGMRLSPGGGFSSDRNFDGVPDILQNRDSGYPGGAQGRGNRSGHPSALRAASGNRDGRSDAFQYQLVERGREGALDRLLYADGDRNRDGITDAYQMSYQMGYRGGALDPMQNQMVPHDVDHFQLGSPRNIGNPALAPPDFETRRQLEMMRNAVAQLEAEVLQAVQAEEEEEEGAMPPPPPLVEKSRPMLKAEQKAKQMQQLYRKIQVSDVGLEADSGSTPDSGFKGVPLMMPPKGGIGIRREIEALQKEAQQLREAAVQEIGGEAATRRIKDYSKGRSASQPRRR